MDKLLMHIGLIDQVTKPLRGITNQMQSTVDAGRKGMANMAVGGAGLVASGMAIQNALMPAIEMDRKLGEVASLGVTGDALKQLEKTALGFSVKYGKSATDFVSASYDIQSAIDGLSGDELSQFTRASGVLAAATKADTGTITNYMGTMYGIFKNQANEMGKGEWVEQVSGMTASAVQMFKTTGSEMSGAFTSIGAEATSVGVGMNEQMAILGTLQATMSGSEAGTKYRAFLGGVAKAQAALGMSFTDSHGQMLPMIDVLDQLKGRYGDTIDVAESAELAKAFGTKEATGMIKLLMADTDGLAQSIDKLGNIQGMSKAEEMASKMTDQWERLEAVWFAVRASVFGAILPAINAVVGSMVGGMSVLMVWIDEFPILGEILGYVAIGAIALGGVVAGLSLAMGIGQMMSAGWALTMGTLNGAFKMLRISTLLTTASTWLFNAALWANPITWIVAGVLALGVAVAGIIYYWDELVASLNKIWIFRKIGDYFAWYGGVVMSVINELGKMWNAFTDVIANNAFIKIMVSAFVTAVDIISAYFDSLIAISMGAWSIIGAGVNLMLTPFKIAFIAIKSFFALLTDGPQAAVAQLSSIFNVFDGITASVMAGWQLMTSGFSGFITALSDLSVFQLIGDGIDWLIDKINMIPGINIDTNTQALAQIPELEVMSQNIPSQLANKYEMQSRELALQQSTFGFSAMANVVPITPEVTIANQTNQETPYVLQQETQNNVVPMTPEVSVVNQLSEAPPIIFQQESQADVMPSESNLISYKQPQNQTALPSNMVQNATTVNKQQQGNNRTYGDITIHSQQPFTPDMLAQWEELNAG